MFCSNGESSKWSVASGAWADTARSEDIGSTRAGAELPFETDDSCFKTGRGDGLGRSLKSDLRMRGWGARDCRQELRIMTARKNNVKVFPPSEPQEQ